MHEDIAAFKGRMVSLTVLEVYGSDLRKIKELLRAKADQAPAFFSKAPLLLDLAGLVDEVDISWLDDVSKVVSSCNFVPVGITGVDKEAALAAKLRGVTVWPNGVNQRSAPEADKEPEKAVAAPEPAHVSAQQSVTSQASSLQQSPSDISSSQSLETPADLSQEAEQAVERTVERGAEQPSATRAAKKDEDKEEDGAEGQAASGPASSDQDDAENGRSGPSGRSGGQTDATADDAVAPTDTLVIYQPVRSGQRVYAKGGDLVVLSSVSEGAEIMADGYIHVYGSLRGRALAGASGREEVRIFCRDLQAELVAIAGVYKTYEDLPQDMLHNAAQIYLEQDDVIVESLEKRKF